MAVQLIWIYFVAVRSPTTSNFIVLLLFVFMHKIFTWVVWVKWSAPFLQNPYTAVVVVFSVDSIIYMQDNSPNLYTKLFNVPFIPRIVHNSRQLYGAPRIEFYREYKGAAKTENCFRIMRRLPRQTVGRQVATTLYLTACSLIQHVALSAANFYLRNQTLVQVPTLPKFSKYFHLQMLSKRLFTCYYNINFTGMKRKNKIKQ